MWREVESVCQPTMMSQRGGQYYALTRKLFSSSGMVLGSFGNKMKHNVTSPGCHYRKYTKQFLLHIK